MATPLFQTEIDRKKWDSTPEEKKIRCITRSIRRLVSCADSQCAFIDDWEQIKGDDKETSHIYVFNTTKTFWKIIDLLLHIGETDFADFGFYPCRTAMETFLQFWYFCQLSQEERNRIAIIEALRTAVRFYCWEKSSGGTGTDFKKYFDIQRPILKLPSIDELTIEGLAEFEKKYLRTFPSIKKLCTQFSAETAVVNYFLYQHFCERVHGSIMSNVMREQSLDKQEYRRALLTVYTFAKDMLALVDKHFFNERFRGQVEIAIKEADDNLRSLVA